MSVVCSSYFLQSGLLDLLEHATSGGFSGVLYGCQIGLFTNNVSLTVNTTLSDLVEANYDTYARQSITWGSPYVQPDGSFGVSSTGVMQFQPSGSSVSTPNTLHGYFVCGTGSGTPLLFAEMFASPLGISAPQDAILISPQVVMTSSSEASAEVWS